MSHFFVVQQVAHVQTLRMPQITVYLSTMTNEQERVTVTLVPRLLARSLGFPLGLTEFPLPSRAVSVTCYHALPGRSRLPLPRHLNGITVTLLSAAHILDFFAARRD